MAVSTINRYLNAIKSALSAAVEAGHIKELPKLEGESEKKLLRERYMLDHEEPLILEWLTRMQSDDLLARGGSVSTSTPSSCSSRTPRPPRPA